MIRTVAFRMTLLAVLAGATAIAHAQERKPAPVPMPPPHFGPSYQSPYNFAPPARIYPTPGGSLFDTPYQGTDGYRKEPAPPAAPPRGAPKSQRLDTRIGPAR
jgi:hypothetical protein